MNDGSISSSGQADELVGKSVAGYRTSRGLRALWAIDENERLVRLAQSPIGKAMLVGLFALLTQALSTSVIAPNVPILVAVAFAYLPDYRNAIAAFFSNAFLIARFYLHPDEELKAINAILSQEGIRNSIALTLIVVSLIAYLAGAWGVLTLVRQQKLVFFARKPVSTLLGITALLFCLACSHLLNGFARAALWAFFTVFTMNIWFLAYAVLEQRSRKPCPMLFQIGVFHPFWGSTSTPYGKGVAYLRRHQSKTAADLAVTQMKGLKLLAWAVVLMLIRQVLYETIELRFGIPKPERVYTAYLAGDPYPIWIDWASLAWATVDAALRLAIMGHEIIGLARLAGFRLPRNMWRPLEARNLAEFWNRYYFYFKELLVEFFFFPTFLKVFRKHPHLRLFAATFMAAGVGNAIFHYIASIDTVATEGLWKVTQSYYASYLFYCTVLATGIGISQARASTGKKPASGLMNRLWSVLCIWSFMTCIYVFGDDSLILSFSERFSFFLTLFGF